MSISPTFYAQLLHTKVLRTAFCTYFRFVLIWRKIIGAKAARKMLVYKYFGAKANALFANFKSEGIKLVVVYVTNQRAIQIGITKYIVHCKVHKVQLVLKIFVFQKRCKKLFDICKKTSVNKVLQFFKLPSLYLEGKT